MDIRRGLGNWLFGDFDFATKTSGFLEFGATLFGIGGWGGMGGWVSENPETRKIRGGWGWGDGFLGFGGGRRRPGREGPPPPSINGWANKDLLIKTKRVSQLPETNNRTSHHSIDKPNLWVCQL